jgi:hypothetical protein
VADERARRIADNESLFRLANERMAGWEERERADAVELYFCECGRSECREKVELVKADYERARSDSATFVVIPGHELPDVESVIETHDGWVLIRKYPEVHDQVAAADPRSDDG